MIKEIVFTNQIHGRCQIKHDILSRFIEQGEDPESYFDRQKPQRCCPGLCESRARYNSNNPLKGYIHVNDT
jgi:hypothetical protein